MRTTRVRKSRKSSELPVGPQLEEKECEKKGSTSACGRADTAPKISCRLLISARGERWTVCPHMDLDCSLVQAQTGPLSPP